MDTKFANTMVTNNLNKLQQALSQHPNGNTILAEYVSDMTALTKAYLDIASIPYPAAKTAHKKKAQPAKNTDSALIAKYTEIALKKAGKQTGLGYFHVRNLWTKQVSPESKLDWYALRVVRQIIQNYCRLDNEKRTA